jgi:EpsI family protein
LLGTTLVLAQGIEFREKIPPNKALAQFPLKIGDWTGKRESMEQRFIDTLDFSDYVIVNYKNNSGKQLNFYTAYYESQRKGESIHSPASCLPGSGWVFEGAGSLEIPVPYKKNDTMPVNRAYMLKNDFRQLSYYWFPQRGRILTNAYQLKLYAFWDALTRQRTDGALVRIITPVYKDENLENAEKRLQSFTRELVPVLGEFLPE